MAQHDNRSDPIVIDDIVTQYTLYKTYVLDGKDTIELQMNKSNPKKKYKIIPNVNETNRYGLLEIIDKPKCALSVDEKNVFDDIVKDSKTNDFHHKVQIDNMGELDAERHMLFIDGEKNIYNAIKDIILDFTGVLEKEYKEASLKYHLDNTEPNLISINGITVDKEFAPYIEGQFAAITAINDALNRCINRIEYESDVMDKVFDIANDILREDEEN